MLAGPFAVAGSGGGLAGAVHQQGLAGFDVIGVAEAVELH